uniref:Uncharacterized protein n=1 Tax=Setaria italica TaxID=4555 RepID=K3Y4I9_SETIT
MRVSQGTGSLSLMTKLTVFYKLCPVYFFLLTGD